MSTPKLPKVFDLTYQWDLFCERAGLPENKMPVDQRREMKRAFFGACGQLLLLLRNELGDYGNENGEEAIEHVLQDMLKQVSDFWEKEMAKQHRSN
jgi:hypothetical protein